MSSEGVLLAVRPMFTSSGGTAENDLARVTQELGRSTHGRWSGDDP